MSNGQILIENVHVWDGVSDDRTAKISVLIENNLIKKVGVDTSDADDGATIIDGKGQTLMPGLIDSHTHMNLMAPGGPIQLETMSWEEIGAVAAYGAREYFMDGFTTIRDIGGMHSGLRKVIDAEMLVGPRIYTSGGFISQTCGHGDLRLDSQLGLTETNGARLGISRLADGRDEVLKACRQSLAGGANYLKVMVGGGVSSEKDPMHSEQYTPDEIRAAVEVAESWGTYVAVHVYQDSHTRRALELGCMSIEHGHFITEETAELIKEKGAFLSVNLTGMHTDILKHPLYGTPGPQNTKVLQFHEGSRSLIEILKKVKPKIVFNTDSVFCPKSVARAHRSFEKWVQAEYLGNVRALKAMTSTPGELAALTGLNNPYPGKLGVIEEGAFADLLVVNGNPLEDITVIGAHPTWMEAPAREEEGIESISLIMKDGKIYKNTL